jgi:hypothetical protein
MTARRKGAAWRGWARAESTLVKMEAEMQRIAGLVSQYPPVAVPRHTVRGMRRDIMKFSERFELLVHEARRAAP